MSEASELSEREKHLLWIIKVQDDALSVAGPILAAVGQTRSKHADEAWAAFSQCLNAVMAAQATVSGATLQ